MSQTKHILVTGGAGYIGSHTVIELINAGYSPVIADNFRNSHKSAISGISEIAQQEIILRELDVCDLDSFDKVFNEFSFVGIIHFAALKAVGESVERPLDYYRNNVLGLLNCIELAEKHKVRNIVFSSSCTVYGEPKGEKIVNEKTEMGVANAPYGYTKQIGEQMINDVIQSGADLRILNLRYFNPVGAHPSSKIGELPIGKPSNLLPFVTQTGVGIHDALKVFGNDYNTADGTCIRDYVHVMDVASAHVKGIEWLEKQSNSFVEILNIGTGKGTSVLEIIHTFEEVSGKKLNWEFAERREGDIEEIYADVSKAKKLLNWSNERTVKDAVQDAWNWELKLKNG
ncbi:MAG: UDP-glucose 4-epimerase GalE [Crocinitomicaceae bacterium]|nr:UDP-glucose 4-epimerase GalE [Crocinitomicaceae bacterium]